MPDPFQILQNNEWGNEPDFIEGDFFGIRNDVCDNAAFKRALNKDSLKINPKDKPEVDGLPQPVPI